MNDIVRTVFRVLLTLVALALLTPMGVLAAVPEISGVRLFDGILSTIIYGGIGIIMAIISVKAIDLVIPGDLKKQLAEDKNAAIGIVVGALALGICIIIAAAVAG